MEVERSGMEVYAHSVSHRKNALSIQSYPGRPYELREVLAALDNGPRDFWSARPIPTKSLKGAQREPRRGRQCRANERA